MGHSNVEPPIQCRYNFERLSEIDDFRKEVVLAYKPYFQTISLSKFENMFLSVNNFELSVFGPTANITSMKPAFGINCFGSFFWVFVITFLRSKIRLENYHFYSNSQL